MPADGSRVYLSFDDGPHPEITIFVLDLLKKYGAKATFFCIGRNVEAHPGLFERIREEGHAVANHSYSHLNGWKSGDDDYLADIGRADKLIGSAMFRPPYGRIRRSQLGRVRQEGLRTVMWTLLSGDFDRSIDGPTCAQLVTGNMRPGDIIVFHDSEKAFERLKYALPVVLEEIKQRGWITEKLG
jgi:peptidoglycan/xylan/chitin deacetylase (PgdA/CDA1 family)